MQKHNFYLKNLKIYASSGKQIIILLRICALAGFIFGLSIIGSYLLSINFMPTLGLETLLYITCLAAFIGIILCFFVGVDFVMPPIVWGELLTFDNSRRIILGENFFKNIEQGSDSRSYLDVPFLRIRICLFYTVFILAWMAFLYFILDSGIGYIIIMLMLINFYIAFFTAQPWVKKKKNNIVLSSSQINPGNFWKGLSGYYMLVSVSFIPAVFQSMGITMAFILSKNEVQREYFIPYIAIIVFMSSISLLPFKKNSSNNFLNKCLRSILIGVGCIIFTFISLDVNFSSNVIQFAGLGNLKNRTIAVNYDSCMVFLKLGLPLQCQTGLNLVKNVNILWRVGEAYISFETREGMRYVIMPADNIHSNIITRKSDAIVAKNE